MQRKKSKQLPLIRIIELKPIDNYQKIKAWTHFTFPGRKGKYSNMEWHWWHFDAIDYNAYNRQANGPFIYSKVNLSIVMLILKKVILITSWAAISIWIIPKFWANLSIGANGILTRPKLMVCGLMLSNISMQILL